MRARFLRRGKIWWRGRGGNGIADGRELGCYIQDRFKLRLSLEAQTLNPLFLPLPYHRCFLPSLCCAAPVSLSSISVVDSRHPLLSIPALCIGIAQKQRQLLVKSSVLLPSWALTYGPGYAQTRSEPIGATSSPSHTPSVLMLTKCLSSPFCTLLSATLTLVSIVCDIFSFLFSISHTWTFIEPGLVHATSFGRSVHILSASFEARSKCSTSIPC